jgi:3-hydroxyisobutyrate dehydrogenase-like beta-hydroxyacid dehydrogenase
VTTVALIGLGEVGRVLAEELAGVASIAAYDTGFADPKSPASGHAAALGLHPAAHAQSVVAEADVVISAVTAANTTAAARSCAPGLRPGTWYLDLNSSSPEQKQAAARVVGDAGGRYVEAAVMSPIQPRRLGAPMLLGGPDAAEFGPVAQGLGFTGTELYADTVGPAAATKLCRSVVVKGLEALLTESLLAARSWGVEKRVLDSLTNMVPAADWTALAGYMMSRSLEHGVRRAEEMREAARTVDDTGITPWMATATAQRQDWASAFSADSAPDDLISMLDAVRSAMTEERAAS